MGPYSEMVYRRCISIPQPGSCTTSYTKTLQVMVVTVCYSMYKDMPGFNRPQ